MGEVGEGFRARATVIVSTLLKRPWVLVTWLLLAVLTVAVHKVVPQPWSAGVYPVALLVALWAFSRASPGEG